MGKIYIVAFLGFVVVVFFASLYAKKTFFSVSEAAAEGAEGDEARRGPGRWEYYNENEHYKRPELEKGVIKQEPDTWVKRSPIPEGPPSPKLGYEASLDYDVKNKKIIRHGGHNQGGGGEQGFETWVYDIAEGTWTLMYPNTSPPGNCCSRTNVYDHANEKFVRFPGFSGHHGWQWSRHIFNSDSSVWAYGLNENRWVNMRPFPEVSVGPARAAAYDTDDQVILVFNVYESGLTAAYDLYANTWTLLNPENEPPKKPSYTPGFNMTYDGSRKLFVLFGVGDGTDPRTFAFDIRKNTWKDMRPEGDPVYYNADPVMSYDSASRVTVCVAANKKDNTLETWAYDAALNRWRKMSPPAEPVPGSDRSRLLTYSPDQNLIILENRYNPGHWREAQQQVWTYRYAQPPGDDTLLPPQNLKLLTTQESIELSWDPDEKAESYNVYHGTGKTPWRVDYSKIASAKTGTFIHKGPEKGKIHYYYVTSVDPKSESAPSLKARSQPGVITDVVVSAVSKDKVEVEWKAENKDVSGYNIYRAETNGPVRERKLKVTGSFKPVNKELIKGTGFTDNILPDKVYAYRVHAVNNLGIEGGPSPYFLTIPSTPEYVFSREDGADCQLKWQKNPEKNIIGYNVYRTRKDKFDDTHDLLNKEPVKGTSFTDSNAAKDMPTQPSSTGRRYYVTAVDFLGQESFPSSPVWFYREWRTFYKTGVWHQ